MLKFTLVLFCAVVVRAQLAEEDKLFCRVCNSAINLGGCTKVAVCDKRYEECYMDEIITEQLTIVYNAGCRAKDVCDGTAPSTVGKREQLIACSRCCSRNDTNGCNKRLCGIPDPGTTNQCYSCNNKEGSSQGYVANAKDCVSFSQCLADEVCFAKSHYDGDTLSFEYGCFKKTLCQVLVEQQIADYARCEGNDEELCGHQSKYCYSCCAWGLCNYGTCKDQVATKTTQSTTVSTTTTAASTSAVPTTTTTAATTSAVPTTTTTAATTSAVPTTTTTAATTSASHTTTTSAIPPTSADASTTTISSGAAVAAAGGR